jgi:UDP-glucose:(heptosyl)LPS alpha-1,3-glucosyltransferase
MKVGVAHIEYSRTRGIERCAAELADRIAERGHEVHFHGAKWMDPRSPGVQFHRVRGVSFPNSAKLLSFAVLGKSSIQHGHYDVTHSYGSVVGCDVITAQSCHRAGMEVAKVFMRNSVGASLNLGIADRTRLLLENQNYAKGRYKKIIACSSVVKRELMEYYGVPDEHITVIPNGVDTDDFHPRKRETFRAHVRSTYGFSQEDIVLLFVGNEFVRKGLETAVRCLAILREQRIKLLVCGGDRPEKFRELARSQNVDHRVVFAGSRADVSRYYAAADIFVFPTYHDAFGLVITEAMASGLPVVVSKIAGAAEDIIEDGKDGLLLSYPPSVEELSKKIQVLRENPSLRERIGREARRKVQRYTWEECADRVERLYEEVHRRKRS